MLFSGCCLLSNYVYFCYRFRNFYKPELTAQNQDSLVIHCPTFNHTTPKKDTEQLVIYRVSKWGYENCELDDDAKVVGSCSEPYSAQTIRIVFREQTPIPNGLEYQPGNSYFFISTSDGTEDGMKLRNGGLCEARNLKLKVHIQGHRHYHTKKRNHHTSAGRAGLKQQVETTTSAAYWDEFLHKFHRSPSSSASSSSDDKNQQTRLHETVALDSSLSGNRNDVIYERSDASFSQALRLDPTSILYEIHEFDENSSLPARSIPFHSVKYFILFILVRWMLPVN